MNITQLKRGQSAIIKQVHGADAIALRLQELGLTLGTKVTLQCAAPLGDPLLLRLRGYSLALRREDAMLLFLKKK
ncbi:MAG: ferrous iron transport protein A [Oscillospiraceae bacterium]|nr:ferrous iron transport protein A [Oscillospiraceae bacterium]